MALLSGCTLVTTILAASEPTLDPLPTVTEEPIATTPTPTPAEVGTPTDFFNLKPGDCFDLNVDESAALLYVSCDPPHLYEAYASYSMPGESTYPGDDEVDMFATTSCLDSFTSYVGTTHAQSMFTISWISPTQRSWESLNDREILCTLTPVDGYATTGSAKDSRR
nr:septum formation family protein [Pseudoclavibacter chungangensis]